MSSQPRMTGGDGRAFLSYTPKAKGTVPFTVRVGTTPRVAVTEAGANLAVGDIAVRSWRWKWRRSWKTPSDEGPTVTLPGKEAGRQTPDARCRETDSAQAQQFYYNVLYVVTQDKAVGSNRSGERAKPDNGSRIRSFRSGTFSCCHPIQRRLGRNSMKCMPPVEDASK